MLAHLKRISSSQSHNFNFPSHCLRADIIIHHHHHGDHHHHHHLHGDHCPHDDNPQRLPDRDQQLHVVLLQARLHRRGVQMLASPGFKHFLQPWLLDFLIKTIFGIFKNATYNKCWQVQVSNISYNHDYSFTLILKKSDSRFEVWTHLKSRSTCASSSVKHKTQSTRLLLGLNSLDSARKTTMHCFVF